MGTSEIILYLLLGVVVVALCSYVLFGSKKVENLFENKMDGDMNWVREKTQEGIDLSAEALKTQNEISQTLKDIKNILEKR